MPEVIINKERFELPEKGLLSDVLPLLRIDRPDGIAIAVNDKVIPRTEWGSYVLRAEDKVFVIRATQGG